MSKIAVILGTAREGRRSAHAAHYVFDQAEAFGMKGVFVDIRDYIERAQTRSMTDDKKAAFANIVTSSDALIIVSPEYNHGYPGELKLFLDSLYAEYQGKPVALCGVSEGGLGGARMVEQLRQICAAFGMIQAKQNVYFSNVKTLFDDTGRITDPSYDDRVKKLLEELAHLIGG